MTGEVTDRLDGITLFGIALFWQKAIEYFIKCTTHFSQTRWNAYFTRDFTAYSFFQTRVECGLLGRRSMHNPTDQWPMIVDGCPIEFSFS